MGFRSEKEGNRIRGWPTWKKEDQGKKSSNGTKWRVDMQTKKKKKKVELTSPGQVEFATIQVQKELPVQRHNSGGLGGELQRKQIFEHFHFAAHPEPGKLLPSAPNQENGVSEGEHRHYQRSPSRNRPRKWKHLQHEVGKTDPEVQRREIVRSVEQKNLQQTSNLRTPHSLFGWIRRKFQTGKTGENWLITEDSICPPQKPGQPQRTRWWNIFWVFPEELWKTRNERQSRVASPVANEPLQNGPNERFPPQQNMPQLQANKNKGGNFWKTERVVLGKKSFGVLFDVGQRPISNNLEPDQDFFEKKNQLLSLV